MKTLYGKFRGEDVESYDNGNTWYWNGDEDFEVDSRYVREVEIIEEKEQ